MGAKIMGFYLAVHLPQNFTSISEGMRAWKPPKLKKYGSHRHPAIFVMTVQCLSLQVTSFRLLLANIITVIIYRAARLLKRGVL